MQAIAKSMLEKWDTPEYQDRLRRMIEERNMLEEIMSPYGAGDERLF